MNVLEKILEEIEEMRNIVESTVSIDCFGKECEHNDCTVCICERAMEIIRSHMDEAKNDDWIPCSERLPEEHDSTFAIYKDTHLWSKSMFEKVSDPVNITYELEDGTRKTGTSYTLDGKWKIEKENRVVKKKVVAWKPLPEAYRAADKPDWKENMLNTFLAGH